MASDDSYNALLSALSPDLAGTLGSYADVSFASSLEVSRSTAPGGDASLMDDEVAETADGDESVEHGAETPVTSPVRPPLPRRGAGAGEERHAGRPESSRVRPADPKPPTPEPRPRSAREVHSGDQRRITPSFSALDPDMEELSARLDELAEVLKHGVLERYRRAKTAQLRARQLELAEAQAAHDAVLLAKQNEHEALKEAFGALQRRTQLLDAAATALRSRVVVHMVQQRIMFKGPQSALRCLTAWREHTAFQARKRTTAVRLQQRQQLALRRRVFHAWRLQATRGHKDAVDAFWKGKVREAGERVMLRYEETVEELQRTVEDQRRLLSESQRQQQMLEESVRRVFLRGVSAMNLEAMELFGRGAGADASAGGRGQDCDGGDARAAESVEGGAYVAADGGGM